ncbi:MAG: hypothetical protein UT48_C0016G0005 [Parcubacteria group bacterium GW2011_GWE2_39_37]|uniref:Uncharacterized protein n=1 Tax=Candidatus Falkowbacteria bacterium GW2011_GWF2_39_8 TaxID=1618642 RepID=A0A0G0Q5M4_9BACT|nr:MAG: hypothetical protein UT48_C0016G0005 [Parcubacteria group bacterium GW2011_GWE2_39_37]KKR32631.1 MAG: hypothetical protein UT64_C0027G0002 [Candidatus Falkowbacteria bacterium GW2011_GWF2_39_8]
MGKNLTKNHNKNKNPETFSPKQTDLIFTYLFSGLIFLVFFFPLDQSSQKNTGFFPTFKAESQITKDALPEDAIELNRKILTITKNTPMEKMAEEISRKDRVVAAFLVGIAMKESKFGTYAPKKNGIDCYNYWGYRGKENTTESGYSCFKSPTEALAVVGGKIDSMVKRGVKTPAQMISWKCGSTCQGHDPASVTKWIKDVSINYYRLNTKEIAKSDR